MCKFSIRSVSLHASSKHRTAEQTINRAVGAARTKKLALLVYTALDRRQEHCSDTNGLPVVHDDERSESSKSF